jgi:hypothetical protein
MVRSGIRDSEIELERLSVGYYTLSTPVHQSRFLAVLGTVE